MANSDNLPTSPVDKNWPKGPNFKGIVFGFCVAIVIVVILAIVLISRSGRKLFPVNTHSTPSQTRLSIPQPVGTLTSGQAA